MNQHIEALQFVLSLQKNKRLTDQNVVRSALEKPLLLDNPAAKLSVSQLDRRQKQRQEAETRKQRLKRSLRRCLIRPLLSQSLHEKLTTAWLLHYPSSTSSELATKRDLHGCKLSVVSCKHQKLGNRRVPLCGVVIRETKTVLHLSQSPKRRVLTILKKGTVFKCGEVEFERL